MENKSKQYIAQDISKELKAKQVGVAVHTLRIVLKLGIIVSLFLNNAPYAAHLSIYLIISEIIDQISLYFIKIKPSLAKQVQVFYVINSVLVISTIGYFAGWVLNDYYLIYIIHISSATLAYGTKIGLFSFILSVFAYSFLLLISQASIQTYIRLPLLSVIVLRVLITRNWYEKIDRALAYVLNIEKTKQDFIAIASHNLRTPVAAIYGYIEVLLRGDKGFLNKDQTTYIKRIRNNNDEMEKLTEQLLQISILEVGKEMNLFKQHSQMEVIIEDLVEKFASVAQEKGLELRFQKKEGMLPLVYIDVEKIKAVLANLIDNAIKYTEKGNIMITALEQKKYIVVSVKDTGVGISKADMPNIFTKFYRSGDILVYNKIGLGLGLYLGRQIVELHGGTMMVQSIEGEGATFSFTIPIVKQDLLQ